MTDFQGLVALVTGGQRNRRGHRASAACARCASAVLERGTDGAPDGVLALRCDVTDTPAVDAAVAAVVERLNGLDVALDVNVRGIATVTRAASIVS
jgi:NAD(P)-dependent dehydrogenase (short-subunit alcohol dehydrogenase family)